MERLLLLWDEMDDWTGLCRHAFVSLWTGFARRGLKIPR
jgi:hypothetical protein